MFFIFFILGLIFGSFINVLVYRLNVAENFTTGRSKCPHCQEMIRWYDNIPLLSFVLLGFRCRDCKEKISWQYPIVEFITGLIFALIGIKFWNSENVSTWIETIYYLGAAVSLITIFVYDFLYMEIPSLVLWPAVAWAVFFNLALDWNRAGSGFPILSSVTYSGVLAAFVFFVFFFLMVSVSRERWMGMGDAYLVILLGLILGFPKLILAVMLAFSIGAAVGIILIFQKKKKMESQLPFAPFLVLGTFISLFFYESIVGWYLGLFY